VKLDKRILADLLMIVGLSGFTIWYLLDAWSASSKIENLMLIVPIVILTLVMCSIELVKQLRQGVTQEHHDREPTKSVAPIIGLFSIYVISLEWVGFDLATVFFVAAFLWLQGERRLFWVIGYSLCFGILVTLFFSYMLPYPMPMSLFPTDY
jgi:putative tricarboxylic transport membrane protein